MTHPKYIPKVVHDFMDLCFGEDDDAKIEFLKLTKKCPCGASLDLWGERCPICYRPARKPNLNYS